MKNTPTPELPKVLMDVTEERERQIAKGWTPEHDDRHNPTDLEWYARARLNTAANRRALNDHAGERASTIEAIAILCALVEAGDRRHG